MNKLTLIAGIAFLTLVGCKSTEQVSNQQAQLNSSQLSNAQLTGAQMQQVSMQMAANGQTKYKPEEMICKRIAATGSRISKKVCFTPAQVAEQERQAELFLERNSNGGR